MMMQWLGEAEAAERIEQAVEAALARGARTPDLGGQSSTGDVTRAVVRELEDNGV